MLYKYITSNNLYEKQNYMYSEYGGIEFIKEYINSRQKYLNIIISGEGGDCPKTHWLDLDNRQSGIIQ